MVKIEKKSINGLVLGTPKDEINMNDERFQGLYLEFNKNSKLETISARNIKSFQINGKYFTFDNIFLFLNEHKVLMEGDFLIIPLLNLSIYIDFKEKKILEILLYDSSIKNIYESGKLLDFKLKGYNIIDGKIVDLIFIPYKSLGPYHFGDKECEYIQRFNLCNDDKNKENKTFYEYEFFLFRFDYSLLSQINIDNSRKQFRIMLNSVNINTLDEINKLLVKNKITESRSHYIFEDLGLAINRKFSKIEDVEYFFFDKKLLQFWKNIYRPITSW